MKDKPVATTPMIDEITIYRRSLENLVDFILAHQYQIELLGDRIIRVMKDDLLDIYLYADFKTLYFQMEIGSINEFKNNQIYYRLLDINTEILPVSVGIDSTDPQDPRIVIVESRELLNMDDNELLSVFDAMHIAADKIEQILIEYL